MMFWDPLGLKDVMGGYIAEKNGGSAKATYNKKGYTSSVTISINDKTKTYTVASGDVKVIHGRDIIDNEKLMNDFGLSEEESLHNEGDVFNNTDDTALAFGLMYYGVSVEEQQEYGASINRIYKDRIKYTFCNVVNSTMAVPAALGDSSELNVEQRKSLDLIRDDNTVATIHTHWDKGGNPNFSNSDYVNEVSSVSVIYLVNNNFEFIKSIRFNTTYDTAGFTKGIRVF